MLGDEVASVSAIVDVLQGLGAVVTEMDHDRRLDDKKRVSIILDVRLPAKITVATLVEHLEIQPGVRRVHVQAAA